MKPSPYDLYPRAAQPLSLADYLAIDRTILANERTLLAYWRTALALAIGGATLVHFFPRSVLFVMGWVLVVAAAVLALWGAYRFARRARPLRRLQARAHSDVHAGLTP